MFYSHQLLARKAPLGQIWMAATLHAKINRRKLDKLNIIKICEEILNPSVPMALRLSGILMGGVVIVYERKVKLLYDDVTRLLIQINEAWKVKSVADPTILPKGKSHAKKEAVTLPENQETDFGDMEQPLHFSDAATTMRFQQTAYFAMRLDEVDETDMNNPREEDLCPESHQADASDITLCERFDLYQTDAEPYNRFERFDIEGDEETQEDIPSVGHTQIPTSFVPSPPPRDEPQRGHSPAGKMEDQTLKDQAVQQPDMLKEPNQLKQGQHQSGAGKRKARRPISAFLDYEQTFVAGHIYQSWLKDASDIVSRRGKKRKGINVTAPMKIAKLMDLPPVVICCGLLENANGGIHYPEPLMKLWMRSMQPPHDSPSGRTSQPRPPEPSSLLSSDRNYYQETIRLPCEDFGNGLSSQINDISIEKHRANLDHNEVPARSFMEEIRANPADRGMDITEGNLMHTPRNSATADEVRSMPSSGSGHGFPSHSLEVNSGRSNKRPYSSSKHSSGGLEPVAEENNDIWQHPDPNFKLSRLSENGSTPEHELLVETGPTQTERPAIDPAIDRMTDSIRMQMKSHFDTPGAPQIESLNELAYGMNRKGAALLFYQACVLATRDILKVEQKVPYGNIFISRGPRM